VESETDGPRYQVGEVDWETADDANAQFHHDIAGEVDAANGWKEPGEEQEEKRDAAFAGATMLAVTLLQFSWMTRNGKLREPLEAARRFTAASAVLEPRLFCDGKLTYEDLGLLCKCTKQALSKIARDFQTEMGLHFRRSQREGSIEHMRDAQRGAKHWRARRRAATPSAH